MKTYIKIPFILIVLASMFTACEPVTPEDDPSSQHCANYFPNVPIVGGGVSNYKSYRNNHYKFSITADGTVLDIKVEFKGTNGRIYLLNSAGDYLTSSYDGVSNSLTAYEFQKSGTYFIVIASENTGDYNLQICGSLADLNPIPSDKLSFNDQVITEGGGISSYKSWRNLHYSFEVTENTSDVDFIVKSNKTNCRIYLLNSAGDYVTSSYDGTNALISPYQLNKGIYSIVVASEEGKETSFGLDIFCKKAIVKNQKLIASSKFSKKVGSLNLGGGINEYKSPLSKKFNFSVLERSHIDLVASSSGLNHRIYILNSAGDYVTSSYVGVQSSVAQYELNVGSYTAVITGDKDKNGTFDVKLHGKAGAITDLQPK